MESTHDPITPATDHSSTVQRSRTAKLPYVEPQIDELGTVERLTGHVSILLPDAPNSRTLL
ncbi:hypothetical protein AB0L26_01415 [Streptomyces nondiastaticus]|uniref:hypothetical protein n=1 Tax=Streptomyces nondiastaticus TaxID=3154512 RepID=UPI00343F3D6D